MAKATTLVYGDRIQKILDPVDAPLVGNDTLYGGEGRDFIFGEEGEDTIYGGLGSDELYGGAGDDTIYFEKDEPGAFNALYGGAGADKFVVDVNPGGGELFDFNRKEGDKIVHKRSASTQVQPSSEDSETQHSEEDHEQSEGGGSERESSTPESEVASTIPPATFSEIQWTSHKDEKGNPYVVIRYDEDTAVTVHGIDHLTESDFLFA